LPGEHDYKISRQKWSEETVVALKRTQVLLEQRQHQALVERARRESRSVSEIVREMVDHDIAMSDGAESERIARALAVLDRGQALSDRILARRGGVPLDLRSVDILDAARDGRDMEIDRASADR
jgi:hypothetical protein